VDFLELTDRLGDCYLWHDPAAVLLIAAGWGGLDGLILQPCQYLPVVTLVRKGLSRLACLVCKTCPCSVAMGVGCTVWSGTELSISLTAAASLGHGVAARVRSALSMGSLPFVMLLQISCPFTALLLLNL
jgi:hypothetical protein